MYRARGIATPGKSVYNPGGRDRWLKRLPVSSRWATGKLHEEYDCLLELKREAEQELLDENITPPGTASDLRQYPKMRFVPLSRRMVDWPGVCLFEGV